jgi:hypothetical protein
MRVQSWPQFKGEAFTYTVDWSVFAGRQSTSVSSVVWSVDSGNATISTEALASNVASALITTGDTGCAMIKLVATMADNQIDIHFFKVDVSDPQCSPQINRYHS